MAPVHDVDWMVVIDQKVETDTVSAALSDVRTKLQSRYQDTPLRTQNRSVGLLFPDFSIDVVPAVVRKAGGYQIPDIAAGKWIYTNPPKHVELVTKQNGATSGMAAGIVRAMKVWNRSSGTRLKSFHLEVMTLRGLDKKPDSFAQGVREAFDQVAAAVMKACGDPAESGNTLDGYLGGQAARDEIAKACKDAARQVGEAIAEEALGRHGPATDRMRKVLGAPF